MRAADAPSNIQDIEAKNSTYFLGNTFISFHANDKELLPGLYQLPEEKILDDRLIEAGSSVNMTNGECHPSTNCGKNMNNYVITGAETEGCTLHLNLHPPI